MGKKGPKPRPPEVRFSEKYLVSEEGCWMWQAFIRPNGYAQFGVAHREIRYAHRWSYENFIGAIPKGKELHHVCGHRSCVNPDHLKPVTRREHQQIDGRDLGAAMRSLTHCPQGHPYDEDNTYVVPGRNHRLCRECRRKRNREQQRRLRAMERSRRESSA